MTQKGSQEGATTTKGPQAKFKRPLVKPIGALPHRTVNAKKPVEAKKTERLQKIIAAAGLASRRKAEEWISEGLVTINGRKAQLGDQANLFEDAIKVKGKLLNPQKQEAKVYYLFHKPKGVISMMSDDPQGRETLKNFTSRIRKRLFPIGRLDFNGEGLLLLTNDGKFANELLSNDMVIRTYEVKIKGSPDEKHLNSLRKGAMINGALVRPIHAIVNRKLKSKCIVEIAFRGPHYADVKELFEMKRFLVERVRRVQIGHILLGAIPPGALKALKKSQMDALLSQTDLGLRSLKKLSSDKIQ